LVDTQTILQVVPALGVIVALLYYSLTIRNTEKQRRKDFMFQSSNLWLHPTFFDSYYQIQDLSERMWDYENLDEYMKKYSMDQRKRMDWILFICNLLGVAYKNGVTTREEVFQLFPTNWVINVFEMSYPSIRDLRLAFSNPELMKPLEELYFEARRINPGYVPRWQKDGVSPTRALHP